MPEVVRVYVEVQLDALPAQLAVLGRGSSGSGFGSAKSVAAVVHERVAVVDVGVVLSAASVVIFNVMIDAVLLLAHGRNPRCHGYCPRQPDQVHGVELDVETVLVVVAAEDVVLLARAAQGVEDTCEC